MKRTPSPLRAAPAAFALALAILLAGPGCGDDGPTVPDLPPEILDVIANPTSIVPGDVARVTALASDPDGTPVTYAWQTRAGSLSSTTGSSVFWTAPAGAGAYAVIVAVTGGEKTVTDSAVVLVGEGSLTVLSDPAGALVTLDDEPVAETTPHTFPRVPIGAHRVTVTDADYVYTETFIDVFTAHGAADTARFTVRPSRFEVFDPGRDDIQRIGSITFLPSGTGVLYGAVTTAQGSGIYTSTLAPRTGEPNGLLLETRVNIDEALAVSPDGRWLIFTGLDDRLLTVRLHDAGGDGLVDSLGSERRVIRSEGYGAAIATDNRLAYTLEPSDADPAPLLAAVFTDGGLGTARIVTAVARRGTWRPAGGNIAYERNGILFHRAADELFVGSEDTLFAAPDLVGALPAWGPHGPGHVAYAVGDVETNLTRVELRVPGADVSAAVFTGLFDPAALAWSPVQRMLAVAHNPGRGQIVLIVQLPVP